jgi:maleamate amidohydrolase
LHERTGPARARINFAARSAQRDAMIAPWQRYLGPEDEAVVARARFGRRMGFGERPAVLVIDAQR